ncbi:Hydrogenase isoenzymes formation protein HypD [Clostridium liquoris]|jgi:hydrogenase expression/formation protein HypD|uniref:Hydrogenase isoenzymes formation protein HypD n=2 Tax=Clostridium liquoris TaxID=1289519 RepID=A0A2T0B4A3_9CLOT|nr:Hydrogenase isoenzymes formation protein HypD [Clostridium liquoris]
MEVCGTHTEAIGRFGLRSILNDNFNLISGPGCPVCVTHSSYIDYVYNLALNENIIIATYGDMIRVPGSTPSISLEKAKALGGDIRIVYSSIDAVSLAIDNPQSKVLFLGIGFETTAPHTAVAIKEAKYNNIKNFYVLSMHKSVEPVMKSLLRDKELNIQGFLCPGHVAAIIGEKGFYFLRDFNCPGVITGFKIEDIVVGLWKLLKMIKERDIGVENAYKSIVSKDGNIVALKVIEEVFYKKKDYWRGIGAIDSSGFKIRDEYGKYNIENIYPLEINKFEENSMCQCGKVLKGIIKPEQCNLFKEVCTPENPIGPCMVSVEGSCAAYYKYY